jgi:hypothetical protein
LTSLSLRTNCDAIGTLGMNHELRTFKGFSDQRLSIVVLGFAIEIISIQIAEEQIWIGFEDRAAERLLRLLRILREWAIANAVMNGQCTKCK